MDLEVLSREPSGRPRPTPMLFVHGAWHAAWCWEAHFLDYFAARGYGCYALSYRGHGRSPGGKPLNQLRVADYVADVEQVASQLPASPIIVGHSAGGFVVQKYLEDHPAPAAVLLASVPPSGALPITLHMLFRHPVVFLQAMITLDMHRLVGTPELAREWFFSATVPADEVSDYSGRLGGESLLAFLDMALLVRLDRRSINTPLLVLGAQADRMTSPAMINRTAKAYRTQAVLISDMAHDMMLEAGWQAVAETIWDWLAALDLD